MDLAATALFAVTGALAAIRKRYDAVGVLVLALVTGLGGGLL
ncbi:MAG TPA: TRIC cation channel family protein, partial [Anaeromyxobacter sp.]|nr:TRIC cation channel family protein [Anaeromyxobacter sp.]